MADDMTNLSVSDILKKLTAPGNNAECLDLYEELARRNTDYIPNYEEIYGGPSIVAKKLSELIPENRANVRILDIGAGTGYVSRELHKYGFNNIDGVDASEGMLKRAKEQNLYKNYICESVTDKQLNIEQETYDAVVMCGCFSPGHMPCGAVHEMIRLLKKGGICCFIIREKFLSTAEKYTGLDELIDTMEVQGKWKKIAREIVPNYAYDLNGVLFSYKKI